jgi:hypothetical protein
MREIQARNCSVVGKREEPGIVDFLSKMSAEFIDDFSRIANG